MENCIQYQPPTTEIPIDVNEKFNEYQPSDIKIPFDVNNKFHVFLSFRGADVRKTLVDHLYESLSGAGLRVFLDSEELEKGKDIDSSLQTAIDTSDILIPIFSKNYAESTWCLKEAARMCRSNGFIIPLFYDVKPCDVRYPQRCEGLFAEAFQKHYNHLDRQDKNTIEEWKNALHQISSRSGWTRADELEYEGRLVKRVVKDVLNTLDNTPMDVPMHLVGLQTDMNGLLRRLDLCSGKNTVRVGVSGIGGVGKTTLAKAVYNEIHRRFDACCFAQKNTNLVDLQRVILRRLVNYHGEVSNVSEGKGLMSERLRGVRALLILDGVDDESHLHAVNGDWFGSGSRIIITSRNQHILNLAKVDSLLKMSGLGEDEALQLFSWHAFSRAYPETPYKELSTKIARACQGHPLSLEVIGAQLFDKKDLQCWEEALHNIGENPEISRVLRISYDGLSRVEKEMFLDIACYFAGERKEDTVIFWEALYSNKVQTAINNLLLKMLINNNRGLVDMHDLLRGMGRGIQEQASNNNRLWLPMGPHKALNRDRAERVEMLVYTGENGREPVSLHSMPSLRYLLLQNTKVVGNIGQLAPNLLWIKIINCEFVSDTWFILKNRFQLDSNWSQVRILSLEQCASLTRIPNTLNSLVNLQCLYLQDCMALATLPNTIGNLSQLKQFYLKGCTSLTSLPDTVGNLMQLAVLHLIDCTGLKSLPSTLGNLAQLRWLYLTRCTGLRKLPNTIGDLAQLERLCLFGCSGLQSLPYTVGKLQKLRALDIIGCSGLGSFHDVVVKLAQLRELNRSGGLGRLVQKKFNIYIGYHTADAEAEEALMGYMHKYPRTGSLGICMGSEDEQSREAIDSSDILVPVLSKRFAESNMCQSKFVTMVSSDGLFIPLALPSFTDFYNNLLMLSGLIY